MDKKNDVQKVKNLSEIVETNPESKPTSAGCVHYKRKAKFVVSSPPPSVHLRSGIEASSREVQEVKNNSSQ